MTRVVSFRCSYTDADSFVGVSGTSATFSHATEIARNTAMLAAMLNGSTDQALRYGDSVFPAYDRSHG
jgi:hypothetical protein